MSLFESNFSPLQIRTAPETAYHFQKIYECHQCRILTWQFSPPPSQMQIRYSGRHRSRHFHTAQGEPFRSREFQAIRYVNRPDRMSTSALGSVNGKKLGRNLRLVWSSNIWCMNVVRIPLRSPKDIFSSTSRPST